MIRTGKDSRNIISVRALHDVQRRAEMLSLSIEDLTLQQIGECMGINKPTMSRIISNVIAAHTRKPAEELQLLGPSTTATFCRARP
ncbi:hypothetical protein Dd1591_1222 [Dickeya chrysanthemi Ech1591]|uniref:Uncharacterized protein n=1 Tax=Dickeya chrysanthemi (strain Ech1591) TaxID=561229 RepID=C6CQ93_DICC1|nr:helix-turn-helix domain-containing protein [Dickeya chrysanthemi]ACT06089.1 hypothetical protein Dd1591_1222 [Dickeya chrysanthemi Ech1591]